MVVERLVFEGLVPEHAEDAVAQTLVAEAVSLALSEVENLGECWKFYLGILLEKLQRNYFVKIPIFCSKCQIIALLTILTNQRSSWSCCIAVVAMVRDRDGLC